MLPLPLETASEKGQPGSKMRFCSVGAAAGAPERSASFGLTCSAQT